MSFKKFLKKVTGQATLEYFILFCIVAFAIIAANFLWFNWNNGQQAEATGQARDIMQAYFEGMRDLILAPPAN